MKRDKISRWVRQARYRAKKYGCESTLSLEETAAICASYGGLCAYCAVAVADMPDHPFPLGGGAPNVAANCLPCCASCRRVKSTTDLVDMCGSGHIGEDKLKELVTAMLTRNGHDALRIHIKTILPMAG